MYVCNATYLLHTLVLTYVHMYCTYLAYIGRHSYTYVRMYAFSHTRGYPVARVLGQTYEVRRVQICEGIPEDQPLPGKLFNWKEGQTVEESVQDAGSLWEEGLYCCTCVYIRPV